ncbi:MAG: hypothetical protein JW966_06730 [Anaerolineae bacterium]|nr:hypothetical protein [Anaerolineae bacterium]
MARRRSSRTTSNRLNRTNVAIGAAALMLVLAIAFPRVYPAAKRGPTCSDLANPLGGNNRSSLSYSKNDQVLLGLDITLEKDTINPTEAIIARVTFVNEDIGPAILYLPRDNPVILIRPDQPVTNAGVTFEVTRVGTSFTRIEQALPAVVPSRVNPEELHLLGSRARCTEEFRISPDLLLAAGVPLEVNGEYRVRAYYRNNNPGAQRTLLAGDATPTATPAYFDQGVWTGQISSSEGLLTVRGPTQ